MLGRVSGCTASRSRHKRGVERSRSRLHSAPRRADRPVLDLKRFGSQSISHPARREPLPWTGPGEHEEWAAPRARGQDQRWCRPHHRSPCCNEYGLGGKSRPNGKHRTWAVGSTAHLSRLLAPRRAPGPLRNDSGGGRFLRGRQPEFLAPGSRADVATELAQPTQSAAAAPRPSSRRVGPCERSMTSD